MNANQANQSNTAGTADNATNPGGVAANQYVLTTDPRGALLALTGKLTKQEERQNLFAPTYRIRLISVKLKNGKAYRYFTMPEGAAFSGALSPLIFKDAVERAALQSASVKKVEVCLDGVSDFRSEAAAAGGRKCR